MIRSLRIQNLATIEDLDLCFREGFTILTGETGAGKSIIIDGIKLLLGEKASPELIRTGKDEATIEAVFDLPLGEKLPAEWASLLAEGELLIQRKIPREGPGKAYLNGVLVPVKTLRELGPAIVDIYGQNDHVFLLHLESHLLFLDQFLGLVQMREEVTALAQKVRRLVREKRELQSRQREREQRLDFLSFQIKEIESAGLRPGEWQELQAERDILKNAEKIFQLVEKALDVSYLGEDSLLAQLGRLEEMVRELEPFERELPSFREFLRQASITVRELADCLVRFRDRQNLGPERLEEVEARLSILDKLRRKYGHDEEDILHFLDRARADYEALVQSEEKLAEVDAELRATFEEYRKKAEDLSSRRKEQASFLEKKMEDELAWLGMKKARFQIKIESSPPALEEPEKIKDTGLDEVEFLISPNPGEELRPLRKIASGGELSRIMLALKTIGKEKARLKTLIFDEIDSGVGGKTAECIAEKLRSLAERHQVICITHLPQIASFAPHHYRIDKKIERERTYTTVAELSFPERIEEISRLLAGSRQTEASLATARDMLLHRQKEGKGKKKSS